MKKPVYMDYAATTPADPAVADEMMKYLTLDGVFGNPASRSHGYGWQAEAAVEAARRQVAQLIGADPREIVWTSGATESDNLAISGVVEGRANPHIVTSIIEHKAVVDTVKALENSGVSVTWLNPGSDGRVTLNQVQEAVNDSTTLVSLMLVNNELGCVNDVATIGAWLRTKGILFHVDAAQAAGKMPVDVSEMSIDLLSLSAHKVYGPKGIGALFVRRSPDVAVHAQIHGGGHERGMRSGTLPTHQIVGMGKAFELARNVLSEEIERMEQLRNQFLAGLAQIEGVSVNGSGDQRVPGILNLGFEGVNAESLMMGLRELAVSSGSACSSESVEPSYVLKGIGLDEKRAQQSLRFSIGRFTDSEQINFAVDQIVQTVSRLRSVR